MGVETEPKTCPLTLVEVLLLRVTREQGNMFYGNYVGIIVFAYIVIAFPFLKATEASNGSCPASLVIFE